mmetsp:Transcript_18389/g.56428  ORF Transcript_18389/g.56428 Transcript_18389/m.56428 type:complete len:228 (-) Transcript_18389:125-808(-)
MGLSGRDGSETAKFCCADCSAIIKRKSGSTSCCVGPMGDVDGSAHRSSDSSVEHSFRTAWASSGKRSRMTDRRILFSDLKSLTCSSNDSSKNFLRMRLRFACSRFLSRRSTLCRSVSSFSSSSSVFRARFVFRFFRCFVVSNSESESDSSARLVAPRRGGFSVFFGGCVGAVGSVMPRRFGNSAGAICGAPPRTVSNVSNRSSCSGTSPANCQSCAKHSSKISSKSI